MTPSDLINLLLKMVLRNFGNRMVKKVSNLKSVKHREKYKTFLTTYQPEKQITSAHFHLLF